MSARRSAPAPTARASTTRAGKYLVELDLVRKRFFRFGFPVQPWQTVPYADNKAIGRFEGTMFDPATWRPRVPTAAFLRARADDTFWAARRVAAFSDEMIRAIVRAGEYSDPADETLLAEVLMQRRDKIARHYLNALNPLVAFSLSPEGRLTFSNAAADARVAEPPAEGYRAAWSAFDNPTGGTRSLGAPTVGARTEIAAPGPLPTALGTYVRIGVSAIGAAHESWSEPVDVYFHRAASGWRLVGVDRLRSSR